MRSPDLWLRGVTEDDVTKKVVVEQPPPIASAALLTIHSKAPLDISKILAVRSEVPQAYWELSKQEPTVEGLTTFIIPGYDKDIDMMGPASASLQTAHNIASDAASKANKQGGSMEPVKIYDMMRKAANDSRNTPSYQNAIKEARVTDCDMNNLPGATRQVRTISVAYSVQTLTPNLNTKIIDIANR